MNPILDPLFSTLDAALASSPELASFELKSLALPAVRLTTKRITQDKLALGESRIGGAPDVPPDFEWPRWTPGKRRDDKYGQPWRPVTPAPLAFIAQLDLSTLPKIDEALPPSGWLLFFYDLYCEPWGFDPADWGSCRVVHVDCERTRLQRGVRPGDLDPGHIGEPSCLQDSVELTVPDDRPGIKFRSPTHDAYISLRERLALPNAKNFHHLLGHPQVIQNPMELECQLVTNGIYCGSSTGYQSRKAKNLETDAADWRLLLQIDTDEDGPGWMWGDCGMLYFWIRKQDLAAHNFKDVWLILQCG